ncbi:MAG: 30S ribosomal protein S20 [Candidatus Nealsonbacteria bacterium]
MPIIKSAKKALRQNIKHKERNLTYSNKMKSLIKKVRLLVSQDKTKEAKNILPQIYKILDKSAKENVIKKNTASRKKSRIARLINKKINH